NATPSFTTNKVTEYRNHFGAVCTMGLSCSTGGDRGLLDFLSIAVAPDGSAEVVWSDGANTNFNGGETSPVIDFARQVSGPSLFGGDVSGPAPAFGSAPGSAAAYFAGNGSEAAAPNNLTVLSSSMQGPDAAGMYTVTMKVKDLTSLAVSQGGGNGVWLTRWELPNPSPTTDNQGQVFFAAMESDGGG